jgi:hypothetical protein
MRSALLSVVLAVFTLASSPALASGPDCPCQADRAQLTAFRDRIAHADTPKEARDMALSKTRLSHQAIETAGRAFPNDPDVVAADAKLDAFEEGVAHADSQEAVAMQFDNLMAQPVDGHCAYSTTEIAIIIIGFLLGIIPGIIFLFLFC